MVKTNDLSKVLKVLETVLNDCLSVKRDDTLIEKLFTFLRHELDLSSDEKQLVLKCLEKSIDLSLNELMANNDCNDWTLIAIKLRICGSILSDKELFVCQQNCLKFIQLISTEVINSNKSLLKFSFFRCLNDICSHKLGRNWMLTTCLSDSSNLKTFPQLLWYFLNKTETRFIERQVFDVFIGLLNHSLSENNFNEDFDAIIPPLISSANPSNIELIKEIIVSNESKLQFIQRYKISDILFNDIELLRDKFGEKLFILCQVLGLCVETNEKADEIIDKLFSLNDLKSFIAFLTDFMQNNTNCDQRLSQKWFNYTIGWFAVKSEPNNWSFDITISDQIFSDRLSDKSFNDFCLKQINRSDFKCFNDKQILVIFEVISKFIETNYEKKEIRKTLLQSFCVLENISLNSKLNNEIIENILQIYSDLLSIVSNDFKLIVLKALRVLIKSKVWPKSYDSENRSLIKLIEQLNEIIVGFDENKSNWETTDSALEVIYHLFSSLTKIGVKFVPICPQLITTVLMIPITNEDNMCSTIRSTLVSVLLIIHLNASQEDLSQLYLLKNISNEIQDLESLSSLLLTDDLSVRTVIIETFEDNIDSLVAIQAQNNQLLGNIIKIVCKLSINDLDEDLQTNALKLLQNLFDKICPQKQFCSTIELFFNSYYFHVIYHLIHSSEYLFKVKQICAQFIEYFKNNLQTFYGQKEPKLEPIITNELQFEDNSDTKLKQILSIRSQNIFDFIMNFDIKAFEDNESEDRPKLNVLDDILSVSLIDTNILIDCY